MPTFLDMLPVESILVETIDPEGPFGAKEVGQGPLLGDFGGGWQFHPRRPAVRIDVIPITPDKVVRAVRDRPGAGAGGWGPDPLPEFDFGRLIRVAVPRASHLDAPSRLRLPHPVDAGGGRGDAAG